MMFVMAQPTCPAQEERAVGASQYLVDTWENDDGLPQNSVISLTKTRDGYLWLGTINGLVRFDGLRFTVFNEDNSPGLGTSPIVGLLEDRKGNLWVGTELSGVVLAKDGVVTPLGIGRGKRESRLRSICEDSIGAIWLSTWDGQLWRYKDGSTNVFVTLPNHGAFQSVIADGGGQVWVCTEQAILEIEAGASVTGTNVPTRRVWPAEQTDFILPSRAGGFWRLAAGTIERWTTNGPSRTVTPRYAWTAKVTSASEDRLGGLLIGTLGEGAFRLGKNGQLQQLSGVQNQYVLSVFADDDNSLWIGSDGNGLSRLKPRQFEVIEPSRGLTVRSVCEDLEGGVWMSFNALDFAGAGAGYYRNQQFRGYGRLEGLMNPTVYSVLVDHRGQIWAGTQGGLFTLFETNFVFATGTEALQSPVFAIHQDAQRLIWFGTASGLVRWNGSNSLTTMTTKDGLSSDQISAVADDRAGNLWVGTKTSGLNVYRNGTFTNVSDFPGEEISSLYVDGEDRLWVGTLGTGLVCHQENRWSRITTRDGLVSNTIGYVIDDAAGYLWVGSNAGLMRIRKQTLLDRMRRQNVSLNVRVFGRADGLPTRECTIGSQPGAWRGRDGRLWMPTTKGLATVEPSRILINTSAPPVQIESVIVDGVDQGLAALRGRLVSPLVLSPKREHLEIGFTSLNLSAPERSRFRFRLEGHENEWVDAGNSRVVHYSKLPPGEYLFRVTACNEDGVWNEQGSSLAIVVEPPFWRTWWFLGVVFASVLGMVAGIVHYISTQKLQRQLADLRQQEALEKERSRIARDIHDQLGANLTQVSLLGELIEGDKDQPEEVALHAKQIQSTALETSRALDQIVWTVNPSNDTLDGLVNYLCKYAQDYLAMAGLKYRLEVPPDLPSTPISPEIRHNLFLAAKEAINNVVKHAQAESAWVRLKLDTGRFTIEVQDDGKGPAGMNEKRAQSRNGLRNMGKRLEDVGGKFEIGPAPERGTLVRLVAPLGNL